MSFEGISIPKIEKDPEKSPEHISTPEDVLFVFEQLTEGKEREEIRKLEDEKGLYLWDIKIKTKDGFSEYSYMRKGSYNEGSAARTAIHVTFFDTEGIPVGGHSVAELIDGKWKLTP